MIQNKPYFTGALLFIYSKYYKDYRLQFDLGYINMTTNRIEYMNNILINGDAYILDETIVFGMEDIKCQSE